MRWILGLGLACNVMSVLAGTINAKVVWLQVAHLGMPVSGVVEEVSVQPGQKVVRGESLVTLDQRLFRNELRRSKAVAEGRKPARDEAERELQRAEELYDRAVSSDFELSQAHIQFADADTALRVAQSEQTRAGWEVERSTLKAPFDGLVLAVHTAPGEAIVSTQQSRELVTLANTDSLAAVARVSGREAAAIAGQKQVFLNLDGESLPARVHWLVPMPGEQQGGYQLVVKAQSRALRDRWGTAVSIEYAD